jgi:hypothetical protein
MRSRRVLPLFLFIVVCLFTPAHPEKKFSASAALARVRLESARKSKPAWKWRVVGPHDFGLPLDLVLSLITAPGIVIPVAFCAGGG